MIFPHSLFFLISIFFYVYSSVLPGDLSVNIYREFLCVTRGLPKDLVGSGMKASRKWPEMRQSMTIGRTR